MRIVKIITLASLFFLSVACDNNLKEIVYHDADLESYTYNNIYEAIGISYVPMRSFFGHQSYYGVNLTTSDELVQPANASGWDDGGIYKQMHLHTWTTESPQMGSMWSGFYNGVIQANNVLELLDEGKIPIPSGFAIENFISEIRVVRAFYYWLILDHFGDAPLIISTKIDSLPDKTFRKDIYNFVVDEINESLPYLSESNNSLSYGRFNKWAAKSLLATVYLNSEVYVGKAEWENCIRECDDIIKSGKYNLEPDYRDVFKANNENSTEIIFSIPFDENQGTGFIVHMFSWHGALKDKKNMRTTPWGSGSAMGVPQFIDTYDFNDSRLYDSWMIGPQYALDNVTPLMGSYDQAGKQINFTKDIPDGMYTGESEGYRMNKFEVEVGAKSNLNNDFPFFRYASILMMKAEALLRLGQADEAATLVSDVRKRAFKDHPQDAMVTGEMLLNDTKYEYGYVEDYNIIDSGNTDPVKFGRMMDELGWEFAWEATRRRDNIRFNVFTQKSWLSHQPNGEDRTMFMIPQSAINANPKLK